MRLYVATAGSDRAVPLAATIPGFQRWPRWSPDGRHIALMSDSRIYDVSSDSSGGIRALIGPDSGATYVAFPEWSPDGRRSRTCRTVPCWFGGSPAVRRVA